MSQIDTDLSESFLGDSSVYPALVDDDGHGTHVAGIIGAIYNGTMGTSGVYPYSTLVSLRVGYNDDVDAGDFADAVVYAEENNIKILNCSLGWLENDYRVRNALSNYSGVIVCAAGKYQPPYETTEMKNNDEWPLYPASYNYDNIIAVGASGENDDILNLSHYGHYSVDLFAPGDFVYSTSRTGGYEFRRGTSMATPLVTGVAAMLLAEHPTYCAYDIKISILDNVELCSSMNGYCVTGGRLNAYDALVNAHTHTHTYQYLVDNPRTDAAHTVTCTICGDTQEVGHSFICGSDNDYQHEYTCTVCHYSIYENHSFGGYTSSNDSTHYRTCSQCGYQSVSAHSYGSYSSSGGSGHSRTCWVCGYSVVENHGTAYEELDDDYHRIYCPQCNYYKGTETHTWKRYIVGPSGIEELLSMGDDPQSQIIYKCSKCGAIQGLY